MPWARLLSICVLAVCLAGCAGRPVSAASARDEAGTFQFGGLDRTYRVHVPPGIRRWSGAQSARRRRYRRRQAGLTEFDAVADVNNLLVAYPDGYDKSWADGRGASPADRHHIDDVGFLVALTSKLVKGLRRRLRDTSSSPACPTAASWPTDWVVIALIFLPRSRPWRAPSALVCRAIRRARCPFWRRTEPPIGWCPSTAGMCTAAAGSATRSRLRAWSTSGARSTGARASRPNRSCPTSGTGPSFAASIPRPAQASAK